MASGLYRIQAGVSRLLIPCIRHSISDSTYPNAGCRNVMSIAFNTGFADDAFEVEKKSNEVQKPINILSLKEKEKGDWKNLTLEEKRMLYQMRFSQPICDTVDQSTDEWKLILGGAFTAMGFMTLGMYAWKSKLKCDGNSNESSLCQNSLKEKENMDMFFDTSYSSEHRI